MGLAGEESLFSFPKSLSVWWSEETEYVLQRIDRWAAYARGYNRLRSARLSPGRMTMQEDGGYGRTERARLRGCCGALGPLDYKSNARLESSCLEAYSLDHSIYFKTIGEIRNERNLDANENPEIGDSNNNNNNNNNDNNNDNGNGSSSNLYSNNSSVSSAKSPPLDCGDFLSSDFDEDELPELDQQLREQLDQLGGEGAQVVQLCRSVMSEDEINNNLRLAAGIPRRLPAAAAQ